MIHHLNRLSQFITLCIDSIDVENITIYYVFRIQKEYGIKCDLFHKILAEVLKIY